MSAKVCHPRLAFKIDHSGLRLDNHAVNLHPTVQKQEPGSLHGNKRCVVTQNL